MTSNTSRRGSGQPEHVRAFNLAARITLAAAVLIVSGGVAAHTDYSEYESAHWLEHVRSTPAQPTQPDDSTAQATARQTREEREAWFQMYGTN